MKGLEREQYLGNTKRIFNNSDGVSIIETEYKNTVFEGWHSHENAHITLFLRGGTLEKRKKEYNVIQPGSLLFYRSDELHLNYETKFPSYNINIEIEESIIKNFNFTEDMFEKAILNDEKVKFIILKMFKESLIGDSFSTDSINMLYAQLASNVDKYERFTNAPQWVSYLFQLLNDCWLENLSLEQLSKILNLNPITISKHFPRYFGCTLGEYMRRQKVQKSLVLIQQSKVPLTEIGFECGFSDQSHFIRVFKEQTGFLPKQYQKLII